jgi:hypothetical protein
MKTMRLRFLSVILISLAASTSCTQEELDQFLSPGLSQSEVISGLREALKVGTDTSVGRLNALNGYFADQAVKILLPPEAQVIQQYVNRLPGGQLLIDEVVLKINRAAEQAASQAKPIFVNAITTITIQDGFTILRGGDTAATEYLRGRTIDSLQASFTPPITQALSTPIVGGISAESAYSNLVNTYNQIPRIPIIFEAPQITQNSLSVHTTRRALDGLFVKVADEEKKIRRDPLHRVTEILKRVFGA